MKLVQHLLDAKGSDVISIAADASVLDAIRVMAERSVGSLLVMDEGQSRMSLKGRTDLIVTSLWTTTSGSTGTFRRAYDEAESDFGETLAGMLR